MINNKRTNYNIDKEAFKENKFIFYLKDIRGNISSWKFIKRNPPPKTFNVSGKVSSGGKTLAGVSISGGGKAATSDASGYYVLRDIKDSIEITFSKETYHSTTAKVSGWKIIDVHLTREEPLVSTRIFSGSVRQRNGNKRVKKAEVILRIEGKSYSYFTDKEGNWISDAIPFDWEQTGTYEVIYKGEKKKGNIPDTASKVLKVGTIHY